MEETPMTPVYYDQFDSYADLPYGEDNPTEAELVYAGYTYEDYSGAALIVYMRDGQWFENNDGHCSCYGLEDWRPEATTPEALLIRKGWPGLAEAVNARMEAK